MATIASTAFQPTVNTSSRSPLRSALDRGSATTVTMRPDALRSRVVAAVPSLASQLGLRKGRASARSSLESCHELRQPLRCEPATGQTDGRHCAFYRIRRPLHLHKGIHVRVLLESNRRTVQLVLHDLPLDLDGHHVTQLLEYIRKGVGVGHSGGYFVPNLEAGLIERRTLPVEVCAPAGIVLVHTQPQHVIAQRHRVIAQIVTRIDEASGIHEAAAGSLDLCSPSRYVVHHALQLYIKHS